MKRDSRNERIEQEIYESESHFERAMRGMIRETMLGLMAQEVESLCGKKHESREGKEYVRWGEESVGF